ncbi:MAG: 6-phosphogluconolactonase [Erythrobacter sp.]|jgi:6-phosphogluconolactonase|nr:6-phosphogluconolactonase [Erythrobacter sp.]
MSDVEIIEGADAQAIAEWLDSRLSWANHHCEDQFAVTIPGGSTPFPILEALVGRDPCPPWSVMHIWPNDDRVVSEDHAASNTGRMRAVLRHTGAQILALSETAAPPHFALTWLGMGADGHIASLFPNTDPRTDDSRAVRCITPDPLPPEAPFDRITLTMPALLDTDAILLTLGGSPDKRAVFDAALAGAKDLPITRLLGAAQARGIPVTCFT